MREVKQRLVEPGMQSVLSARMPLVEGSVRFDFKEQRRNQLYFLARPLIE